MDDRELLRQFLASRDEKAFTELVRRYVDIVYSAARRQVRDPGAAEDVTQRVFVLLARKAATIREEEALSGWLLATTRYTSVDVLRVESRRRRREAEAAAMKSEIDALVEPAWDSVQPLIDEGMAKLSPADRDVLALRYFQNLSLTEVGQSMGVSQAAAQKRVHRAVGRLREWFARRGVKTSVETLAAVVAANVVAPAPAALGVTVAGAALSAGPIAAATWISTLKGVVLMATAKTKVAIALAVVFTLAGVGGVVVYQVSHSSSAPQSVVLEVANPSPAVAPRIGNRPPMAESSRVALTRADQDARIREVYALLPGEFVKRVPLTPERDQYMTIGNRQSNEPYTAFVAWDDQDRRPMSRKIGTVSLGYVLTKVVGVWPQETTLPPELMGRTLEGDWAFRSTATQDQLAGAISPLIADIVGPGMVLKATPMERDVIVVTGTPDFKSLKTSTLSNMPIKRVQFYQGDLSTSNRVASASSHSLKESLQHLGELMARPIVVESQIDLSQNIVTETHRSTQILTEQGRTPSPEVIDEVLEKVANQTSLELKRERRVVPMWGLSKSPE